MGDRTDDLAERVTAVETRMDQVPETIEQRFDGVDAAIAEQRQYTEFAFDKLERRMDARFDGVDAKFDGVDAKFDGVDRKFAEVKAEVLGAVGRLERKLDQFIDRQLPPRHSDAPDDEK